ncbi:hypothetical protein GCM10020256_05330 [Streptomyces thermocoprophilus]
MTTRLAAYQGMPYWVPPEPPGFGEAGQPAVAAPVPQRFQGQIEQPALVDVLRHLGVADLDDVGQILAGRALAGARLEGGLHLGADAGPFLDADVEVEVGVGAFEVLGEAAQEVR